MSEAMLSRAQGCIMGQFAGDSLGATVECHTAKSIKSSFPKGLRELIGGGVHNIIAGQPTDDSEMAMSLAKTIIDKNGYYAGATLTAYKEWVKSYPFSIGTTTLNSLRGYHNPRSQANGALMRVSPLGIFGARHSDEHVEEWAKQDCMLTHINPICVQINQLYATAIAYAIRTGIGRHDLYNYIANKANIIEADQAVIYTIAMAKDKPPKDYVTKQGWIFVAFQNALWQLLHTENTEEGIVDTVMRGGDTDTNACICGALLGAVNGIESIPKQWIEIVTNCRPDANNKKVPTPRPEYYWPVDILVLAERLLSIRVWYA